MITLDFKEELKSPLILLLVAIPKQAEHACLGARPIDLSTKKFLLFAIRFFLVPIKLFPCLAFHYTFFPFFMGAKHSTGMRYGHEKKSKAAPRKKQSNFSSSKQHLFCCMLNKCLSAQRSFVAILLTCQKFIVDLLE